MAKRPVDEAGTPMGWRAHLIGDAIVEMLQQLWGNDTRRDTILDAYDWDADPQITQVEISKEHESDWENASIDLEFVVEPGDTEFEGLNMGDFHSFEGKRCKVKWMTETPFRIKCISDNKEHAHMAAAEVAIRLREIRLRAIQHNKWNDWSVKGYSAPKPLDKETGGAPYVSTVSVVAKAEMNAVFDVQ